MLVSETQWSMIAGVAMGRGGCLLEPKHLWLQSSGLREKKHIYIAQYFYVLNSLSSAIGHMDKPKQRRNAYFFVYGHRQLFPLSI